MQGPTWLCGGASFKQSEDSKEAQDDHPQKRASHAAALPRKASKEADPGVVEHHAVDHAGSVINYAIQQTPSSGNSAKATLAVHDSTSSLHYMASACEQDDTTSAMLEDGLRCVRRRGSLLPRT